MTTLPEIESQLECGHVVSINTNVAGYLLERSISRSDIRSILSCPAKWHKVGAEKDKPNRSTEFGSLLDCLLLQPHKLADYYKLTPKTYKNGKHEEKDWTWKSPTCREWRDQQTERGYAVCSEEDQRESKSAITQLMQSEHGEQMRRLLDNASCQVFSIAKYVDKETGVQAWVKCLTDIMPHEGDPEFSKSLFDLKTAKSAAPRAWTKAVFDNDYHVQAALNLDIQRAATGRDFCDFRHLIIENQPPYEPAKRFLSQEFINLGRETYMRGLKTYCRCVAEKSWPSYRDTTKLLLADGFEACEPEPWMLMS